MAKKEKVNFNDYTPEELQRELAETKEKLFQIALQAFRSLKTHLRHHKPCEQKYFTALSKGYTFLCLLMRLSYISISNIDY
jgi:hypothetical protein